MSDNTIIEFFNQFDKRFRWDRLQYKYPNIYKTAIYVWTKLDPKKIEITKINKLNYLIFWNLDEFDNWIINL